MTGARRVWSPPSDEAGRAAFAAAVAPFLLRDEARNNLALGVLDGVVTGRYRDAVLVAAGIGGDPDGPPTEVTAALLRTPPFPLLLPAGTDAAGRAALLAWMRDHDPPPPAPAIVGPLPEVEEAARWWAAARGARARVHMRQGVYELRAVRPAARAGGRMRLALEPDRARVVPWLLAFVEEAKGGAVAAPPDETFSSFVAGAVRRLFLWEAPDGEVVSLAGRAGRTPHGVRIGPVYTPPERRGRGYGEALVAAVSQRELDDGARACYLYTDLDYGASNRLYRRVGYEAVGESAEIAFEADGAPAAPA